MTAPVFLHHQSSLEHDTGPHPENAARIPAIEQELERRGWLGYERREAPKVSLEVLSAVHPRDYVDSVREFCEEGGGAFDADTLASAGSYNAALHAAGAACALAEGLLAGSLPTGFCALRPPGHHAENARAMGFCLFNNVAVAAQHAVDSLGAERVMVVDWDVHHGNGTNDIFHSSPEVMYVSIHEWPLYPGTGGLADRGSGAGEGYTVNLPVPSGSGDRTWLGLVEHVVVPLGRRYDPDLIFISAGFDAHRADPLATCRAETETYAAMAAHLRDLGKEVGAPVAALLEGGYDLRALAESVAATMEALAGTNGLRSVEADALTRELGARLS